MQRVRSDPWNFATCWCRWTVEDKIAAGHDLDGDLSNPIASRRSPSQAQATLSEQITCSSKGYDSPWHLCWEPAIPDSRWLHYWAHTEWACPCGSFTARLQSELFKLQVGKSKQQEQSIKIAQGESWIPLNPTRLFCVGGSDVCPRTLPRARKWLFQKWPLRWPYSCIYEIFPGVNKDGWDTVKPTS